MRSNGFYNLNIGTERVLPQRMNFKIHSSRGRSNGRGRGGCANVHTNPTLVGYSSRSELPVRNSNLSGSSMVYRGNRMGYRGNTMVYRGSQGVRNNNNCTIYNAPVDDTDGYVIAVDRPSPPSQGSKRTFSYNNSMGESAGPTVNIDVGFPYVRHPSNQNMKYNARGRVNIQGYANKPVAKVDHSECDHRIHMGDHPPPRQPVPPSYHSPMSPQTGQLHRNNTERIPRYMELGERGDGRRSIPAPPPSNTGPYSPHIARQNDNNMGHRNIRHVGVTKPSQLPNTVISRQNYDPHVDMGHQVQVLPSPPDYRSGEINQFKPPTPPPPESSSSRLYSTNIAPPPPPISVPAPPTGAPLRAQDRRANTNDNRNSSNCITPPTAHHTHRQFKAEPTTCSTCNKEFWSNHALQKHIHDTHIQCEVEGCDFSAAADVLDKHKLRHLVNIVGGYEEEKDTKLWLEARKRNYPIKGVQRKKPDKNVKLSALEIIIRQNMEQTDASILSKRNIKSGLVPALQGNVNRTIEAMEESIGVVANVHSPAGARMQRKQQQLLSMLNSKRVVNHGGSVPLNMLLIPFPICPHFLSSNNCRYQDKCHLSHDVSSYKRYQYQRLRSGLDIPKRCPLTYILNSKEILQSEVLLLEVLRYYYNNNWLQNTKTSVGGSGSPDEDCSASGTGVSGSNSTTDGDICNEDVHIKEEEQNHSSQDALVVGAQD